MFFLCWFSGIDIKQSQYVILVHHAFRSGRRDKKWSDTIDTKTFISCCLMLGKRFFSSRKVITTTPAITSTTHITAAASTAAATTAMLKLSLFTHMTFASLHFLL